VLQAYLVRAGRQAELVDNGSSGLGASSNHEKHYFCSTVFNLFCPLPRPGSLFQSRAQRQSFPLSVLFCKRQLPQMLQLFWLRWLLPNAPSTPKSWPWHALPLTAPILNFLGAGAPTLPHPRVWVRRGCGKAAHSPDVPECMLFKGRCPLLPLLTRVGVVVQPGSGCHHRLPAGSVL
jgi:hypothetical protein